MKNVSVIIPTWNRKKTLTKAVKSVLNQTISVLEILICDDGSTDGTLEMIKSLNNPKIKWIAGKHTGLPAVVRNRGIRVSNGEWLAFLDSDDEWFPKKLEKQCELIKKTNCLAICCNAFGVDSKGEKKKYLNYPKDIITFSNLIKENHVITSSVIINRSLLTSCFGFSENPKLTIGEDCALWLRVLTKTNFMYINEILVNYSNNPITSIRKFSGNPHLQKMSIFEDFIRWGLTRRINNRYLVDAYYGYFRSSINLLFSSIFY